MKRLFLVVALLVSHDQESQLTTFTASGILRISESQFQASRGFTHARVDIYSMSLSYYLTHHVFLLVLLLAVILGRRVGAVIADCSIN